MTKEVPCLNITRVKYEVIINDFPSYFEHTKKLPTSALATYIQSCDLPHHSVTIAPSIYFVAKFKISTSFLAPFHLAATEYILEGAGAIINGLAAAFVAGTMSASSRKFFPTP